MNTVKLNNLARAIAAEKRAGKFNFQVNEMAWTLSRESGYSIEDVMERANQLAEML